MGGAAGNQATNIVVRALALGEVTTHDIGRLFWKQIRVGLVAGVATGVLAGLMASVVAIVLHSSPLLGALVFTAMTLNVTVGSTLGAMTPMLLARMNKDPALASSLLLTATTDMVGLLILLGLTAATLHLLTI
jgi:magnesium transporter